MNAKRTKKNGLNGFKAKQTAPTKYRRMKKKKLPTVGSLAECYKWSTNKQFIQYRMIRDYPKNTIAQKLSVGLI
jgi:hypothetical protein